MTKGRKPTFESEGTGVNGTVEVGPSPLTALYPDMECRRYSSVVWVVGQGQMVEGDACRGANGPWQAMGIHERKKAARSTRSASSKGSEATLRQ